MVKRRQFIGGLVALGGTYLLSACGGGGSEDGSSTSAAADTTAQPTSHAATSASGTTMPPATSLTDGAGSTWTMTGGVLYVNGAKAANNYNVTLALCYNGSIYCQNTSGSFYQWTGSAWSSCTDPRLTGGTSADGTTLPTASVIIDKAGYKWTLVSGVVYRNGTVAGTTSNIATVLWYGGKVYICNKTGNWFAQASVSSWWLACTDPRIAVAATAGSFYGINGHHDYTYTPSQLVSILQTLGVKTYRVGCSSATSQTSAVAKIAQALRPAGISTFALIQQGLYDSTGALFTSETAAYNAGFSAGATVATALMPYGVTMYECGNELTRDRAIILDSTNAGTKALDFNNTNWPILRGVIRGMIDGVKSVQPAAKCGVNFCVNDVGASDALWEGTQPDGTSGYSKVRWDLTTWHNYEPYGDIFSLGSDGASPGFDLPTYCKARYGVPFILSEWNTGPEQTVAYRATYITKQYGEFYKARKTSNIQSVMYYVLDSGNSTYGIMINGTPVTGSYNAFAAFIASNPDV